MMNEKYIYFKIPKEKLSTDKESYNLCLKPCPPKAQICTCCDRNLRKYRVKERPETKKYYVLILTNKTSRIVCDQLFRTEQDALDAYQPESAATGMTARAYPVYLPFQPSDIESLVQWSIGEEKEEK